MLIHYTDLSADLDGQMRQLASRLGITVPDSAWPGPVEAATFASMRETAEKITGSGQILKAPRPFFVAALTANEPAHNYARAAELAPADMLRWLHRP